MKKSQTSCISTTSLHLVALLCAATFVFTASAQDNNPVPSVTPLPQPDAAPRRATPQSDWEKSVSEQKERTAARMAYLRSFKERMDSGKELTGEECAQFIVRAELAGMIPDGMGVSSGTPGVTWHPRADFAFAFSLLNELFPTVVKWHEAQKLSLPNVPPDLAKDVNKQLFEQFNEQAKDFVGRFAGYDLAAFVGIYLDWAAATLATLKTPEELKAAIDEDDEFGPKINYVGQPVRHRTRPGRRNMDNMPEIFSRDSQNKVSSYMGGSSVVALKPLRTDIRRGLATFYIQASANPPPAPSTAPVELTTTLPPLNKLAPEMFPLLQITPLEEPPSLGRILRVLYGVLEKDDIYTDAANRAKLVTIAKTLDAIFQMAPEMFEAAETAQSRTWDGNVLWRMYFSAEQGQEKPLVRELKHVKAEDAFAMLVDELGVISKYTNSKLSISVPIEGNILNIRGSPDIRNRATTLLDLFDRPAKSPDTAEPASAN